MFNVQKLMQEAEKAQQKVIDAQDRLAAMTVEGSSGGGMVVVTANGKGSISNIRIEDAVIDVSEKGLLEDLIMAAVNDAVGKAQELQGQEMSSAMGGLGGNLGGLGNLLGRQ